MVPFEPKTDSKEFEIASLVQGTGDVGPASQSADLTIRILRRDASSGTAAETWNSESVLVYMISDLVAASHGRTAVEIPSVMAAHFDNSLQALVAAKRIQTAILEFLSCRPGDSEGAAILIHPVAAAGFSVTMAQSALRLAEPGQIILSQEVAKRFQDLPGIELRAVPALTTGGTEHAGLSELIWTSKDRMASRRSTVPADVPTTSVGAPMGATMIVNSPSAGPGISPREPAGRDSAFEETIAEFEEHQSFITPLKLAIGAIAIVLLIVGLVLFHPWSASKVQPKPQALETPTGEPPVTPAPSADISPQPPPTVQPAEALPAKPQPPPVKPHKEASTARDNNKRKQEDTPIQGFEGNSTYDGMTHKDISRLLQWARSDAGNGNYTKAAQEYRVVLQLDPSNADAKEGLRKIQLAQERN